MAATLLELLELLLEELLLELLELLLEELLLELLELLLLELLLEELLDDELNTTLKVHSPDRFGLPGPPLQLLTLNEYVFCPVPFKS